MLPNRYISFNEDGDGIKRENILDLDTFFIELFGINCQFKFLRKKV